MHHLTLLLFTFLLSSFCSGATIYVPDSYPSIQGAINAAASGDTIIVRPGTYFENIDFTGKNVRVTSEAGPERTVIDGGNPVNPNDGSVAIFRSGEGAGAVLEGFTLTNGTGIAGFSGDSSGGGIYIYNFSSPTIIGNIVTRNCADDGGGLSCGHDSKSLISGNTFSENVASFNGAAGLSIGYASPTVTGNRIVANSSQNGVGGISSWYATPVIDGNEISENFNGGIYCMGQPAPVITNNRIFRNHAYAGGGINCDWADQYEIRGNLIYENSAFMGGGIRFSQGSALFENNCVWNNEAQSTGGGIVNYGCDLILSGITFFGNTAGQSGGALNGTRQKTVVVNSIFRNNEAPLGPEIYTSSLEISYCNVDGGAGAIGLEPGAVITPGPGLFDADPLFHDPERGDFHLRQAPCQAGSVSPCVDAGDPATQVPDASTRTDRVPDAGVIDLGYHDPLKPALEVPGVYATIQDAIDAAGDGDVVVVDSGTYAEKIDFIGKRIVVRSRTGAAATVIDGGRTGSVVTFAGGEGTDSVLQGFTVTNGTGRGLGHGGGIYCEDSSPTISNNRIVSNEGRYGAGIYMFKGSPHVNGNLIQGNVTPFGYTGGGIHCSLGSPVVERNSFLDNESGGRGGGIYVYGGSPIIADNHFNGNSAEEGGALCVDTGRPTVTGNSVIANTATSQGGGISVIATSDNLFDGNLVAGNLSAGTFGEGGAVRVYVASAHFTNCVFIGNGARVEGGAFRVHEGDLTATNCTIVGNASAGGGGLACRGGVVRLTNTILHKNTAQQGPAVLLRSGGSVPSTLTVSYSVIENYPSSIKVESGAVLNAGAGLITLDPQLYDLTGHDVHLTASSPCRDAGTILAPGLQGSDFEGDPRIAGGTPDIGADEFHPHLYMIGKVAPGSLVDVRIVGNPGSPATIVKGPGVRALPLETILGIIHLKQPFHFIPLGPIPAEGVLSQPLPVPGGWVQEEEHYFQAFSGKSITNLYVLTVK